jgi:hypothetical protein
LASVCFVKPGRLATLARTVEQPVLRKHGGNECVAKDAMLPAGVREHGVQVVDEAVKALDDGHRCLGLGLSVVGRRPIHKISK